MVPSIDVRTGETVAEVAAESTPELVGRAAEAAGAAAGPLDELGRSGRAGLLRALAAALADDGDAVVALADRETGLGDTRLTGELTRTCHQLRLFAEVLDEGSYLEATIDRAGQTPMGPRPDLRRMLVPVGPVAVFGAGNFPLAFGVPGGDTASALAAGCPVVAKAHPGHPATALRCHATMAEVIAGYGLPAGTIGLVHGRAAGADLVAQPAVAAVGFTGSLAGGRALHDIAASRPVPIPFHGELGSVNPVIVTPGAARSDAAGIASGFVASFTLGTGQFCTKPGILFVPASADGDRLRDAAAAEVAAGTPGTLLGAAIRDGFRERIDRWRTDPRVTVLAEAGSGRTGAGFSAAPVLLSVAAVDLAGDLLAECFGPAALVVGYQELDEVSAALRRLGGQLTATVRAAGDEPEVTGRLARELRGLAGRLLFDGFPTGVAVSWAQQHGGPYPATTGGLFTSVGASAIRRWLRPVTYQQAPEVVLPVELRDGNPTGIPRRVDGRLELGGDRPA
ncbi:aldehyde dehydrogenase (NADP(+)) [Solwaraspora sp. WMMD1047]|uniref:aldehyde dehydrogenase (NADP(+)) n=1 Tax=Solwaraspora sp. WMMD1047 TaxID=3016102 RepID=UPI002416A248|nr:aldehyde dehydrogenase (NADP(+)) [Solwaraspora sp. WMMD1047]MDG4829358.1 aldehyde dehydrogenase (NADP(+)) [Solwaraspora sp. WMMD1047]